jgi:plasmid stabilization system protein ParE
MGWPDAYKWVEKLQQRAEGIAKAPRAARVVPELERDEIREVIVGNYRIVFRIESKRVVILTVFEGHQLLKNALASLDDDPA